jgi:hypothetical protein
VKDRSVILSPIRRVRAAGCQSPNFCLSFPYSCCCNYFTRPGLTVIQARDRVFAGKALPKRRSTK